ncbi:MAG: sigma-70 family RNA polymerase sigma factor [Anaerolineaceae bacterium]
MNKTAEANPIIADRPSDYENDIVLTAQSDLSKFEPLFAYWFQPVYRYALSRVGNVSDAEDITSQTFLAVYEKLPKYRHQDQFSAWLFTIARNKVRDYFRKKDRTSDNVEIDDLLMFQDDWSSAKNADEKLELARIIKAMPENKQDLLRLRYIAGLSFADMGKLLGKREDTVRKSHSRVMRWLQSQMEVYDE